LLSFAPLFLQVLMLAEGEGPDVYGTRSYKIARYRICALWNKIRFSDCFGWCVCLAQITDKVKYYITQSIGITPTISFELLFISLLVELMPKIRKDTFGKFLYELFFIGTCTVCKHLGKARSKIFLNWFYEVIYFSNYKY
jgi:hypothetical protein